MVKVIAENFMKKSELKNSLPLYQELVAETRKEEGCVSYDVYQDNADETHLTFVEEWGSQDALDKHFQTPHFTKLVPMIGELVEKDSVVHVYTKLI